MFIMILEGLDKSQDLWGISTHSHIINTEKNFWNYASNLIELSNFPDVSNFHLFVHNVESSESHSFIYIVTSKAACYTSSLIWHQCNFYIANTSLGPIISMFSFMYH